MIDKIDSIQGSTGGTSNLKRLLDSTSVNSTQSTSTSANSNSNEFATDPIPIQSNSIQSHSNPIKLIKPLPLRLFTTSISTTFTGKNNLVPSKLIRTEENENDKKFIKGTELSLESIKTNAELLEIKVEEQELKSKRCKLEEIEKVEVEKVSDTGVLDNIHFNSSFITLTDKNGSNFIRLVPLSCQFNIQKVSFEWYIMLNEIYYLINLPLSHLSFISFSATSLTITLIKPPILRSKPLNNEFNLPWTLINQCSLGNFNPTFCNLGEENFHHLEISNSIESELLFWELRNLLPLIEELLDTSRLIPLDLVEVNSISTGTNSIVSTFNYQTQPLPISNSDYFHSYQPTPPPSPHLNLNYKQSYFQPRTRSANYNFNSTIPLPLLPTFDYQFPLPPPIPSLKFNFPSLLPQYQQQLYSPLETPTSSNSSNSFQNNFEPSFQLLNSFNSTEMGLGLILNCEKNEVVSQELKIHLKQRIEEEEQEKIEESWWWG